MSCSSGCAKTNTSARNNTRKPLRRRSVCTLAQRQLSESQYFIDAAAKEVAQGSGRTSLTGQAPSIQPWISACSGPPSKLLPTACSWSTNNWRLSHRILASASRPQVALIALDPHTGEIKALCGGRDYAVSQLDRVFAKRPPGSVFKPFVYTAALNTAIAGGDPGPNSRVPGG